MSTFVISDIHGNLRAFKALLEKINFKYDGTDNLYLLGDYTDWGEESIETLLFVIDLVEKYPFVKALIGNHDLMFLDQIKAYKESVTNIDDNWLFINGGEKTFVDFLNLDDDTKRKIEDFYDNLPYRLETTVNNKRYLMAHACPIEEFKYDDSLSKEENENIFLENRFNAVWTRITRKVPSVIRWFDDKKVYENFICGHTITSPQNSKDHNDIIIKEDNYINIDCGAKLLSHTENPSSKYARLAALRLDDFCEFYQEYEKVDKD